MTDRAELEEAIRLAHIPADHMSLGAVCVSHAALKTILEAAEAHLATLPRKVKVTRWLVVHPKRGDWGPYADHSDAICNQRIYPGSFIVEMTGEYEVSA